MNQTKKNNNSSLSCSLSWWYNPLTLQLPNLWLMNVHQSCHNLPYTQRHQTVQLMYDAILWTFWDGHRGVSQSSCAAWIRFPFLPWRLSLRHHAGLPLHPSTFCLCCKSTFPSVGIYSRRQPFKSTLVQRQHRHVTKFDIYKTDQQQNIPFWSHKTIRHSSDSCLLTA